MIANRASSNHSSTSVTVSFHPRLRIVLSKDLCWKIRNINCHTLTTPSTRIHLTSYKMKTRNQNPTSSAHGGIGERRPSAQGKKKTKRTTQENKVVGSDSSSTTSAVRRSDRERKITPRLAELHWAIDRQGPSTSANAQQRKKAKSRRQRSLRKNSSVVVANNRSSINTATAVHTHTGGTKIPLAEMSKQQLLGVIKRLRKKIRDLRQANLELKNDVQLLQAKQESIDGFLEQKLKEMEEMVIKNVKAEMSKLRAALKPRRSAN